MHNIQTDITSNNLLLHLSLGRITFLSFQEKIFLFKNIDSADSLALLSIEEIEKLLGRKIKNRNAWDGKENLHMAQVALYRCQQMDIKILLHSDEEYPEYLRNISDPPYLIFARGDVSILSDRGVSVVGTRKLTPSGKITAADFAYDAVLDGCNVVSGLANGADGFAHKGAVDAYFDCTEKGMDVNALGKTIAVIPSAIDEIIPYGHKKLAAQILQCGGCIVSEYEPGMSMAAWHYVGRNRIIAGLTQGTVVIEAPAGSGALITADFALDYNRDVFIHQAALGEMAKKVNTTVSIELEKAHAKGSVSTYKLENTVEKFLEAGSPVIKDYKDYLNALREVPGERNINPETLKPVQGELDFESNA